ncbi:MAG: DDE-type integrase/transposase/recombinase [Rhodoblastus sp.]
MRDWLSTAEFAALALPGLPATQRGWNEFAEREGWLSQTNLVRQRKARGGGLEYHISLLPQAALALYTARTVGAVALGHEDAARAAAEPAAEQLTMPAIETRDAKLALIAAADRFARDAALTRNTADRLFSVQYNRSAIEMEPWIRQAVRELSPRTLARWRAAARQGAAKLGVDRGAARRGTGALDAPEVRAFVLGLIAYQPHITAKRVADNLGARFPGLTPPVRTVQHVLKRLKTDEKIALTAITNPDAFKSKYELSGANSNAVERLNEQWQIDASPADVLLTTGRHSIYACIDRFSRRTIILVTKTPRADAVALLIRKALLAWGVPERIKTDNGSDFRAKRTVGLFAALGIEIEVSPPFTPKAKAHVERVIGTFQRDCAADLPGFIGHSVADRKVIEERKAFASRLGESADHVFCVEMDAQAFQARCDHWAEIRYAHAPHAGLKGATPAAVAAAWPGKLRRIDDIRALDMLLAPIAGGDGLRIVTKRGVRVENAHYLTPSVLPETRCLVRMDPADLGRIWLFSEDGAEFLGEGICPELAGVDPQKAVAEAKAINRRLVAESAAEIKAAMREVKRDKAALAEAIARREAEAAGKLVAFPRAAETHTTPALQAAGEAVADHVVAPAEKVAPIAAPAVHRLPETKQQRFRRALALERDLAAGLALATDDAMWLGGYQTTAEYQALHDAYEDFGEAALR